MKRNLSVCTSKIARQLIVGLLRQADQVVSGQAQKRKIFERTGISQKPTLEIHTMQTIQQQLDEIKELYNKGVVSEALYISTRATLNASLGTDFRRDGITMNVPPLQATLKDKKDRKGNIIVKDFETVKGGLVTVTGTVNGAKINSLYMNVEVVQWIINNGGAIEEYLSQDHMEYRRAGQTDMADGALTATELFS